MEDSGTPKEPGQEEEATGGADSAGAEAPSRAPLQSLVVPRPAALRSTTGESAAELLLRALRAHSWPQRQACANAGLSRLETEPEDDELKALLLRQLYLAALEEGDFEEALAIAEEMVELEELGDVARQDAARAAAGLNLIDVARAHLEIAAAICPTSRRAFHWATLGALLRFTGRTEQAIFAFQRALQTAQDDQDLYRAQLVLAEVAAGKPRTFDLGELRSRLESAPPTRGYTLWVLGEVCSLLGDKATSRTYLESFLNRMTDASRAKTLALRGELAHAEELLQQIG